MRLYRQLAAGCLACSTRQPIVTGPVWGSGLSLVRCSEHVSPDRMADDMRSACHLLHGLTLGTCQ